MTIWNLIRQPGEATDRHELRWQFVGSGVRITQKRADEFVVSGIDLRQLVETATLADAFAMAERMHDAALGARDNEQVGEHGHKAQAHSDTSKAAEVSVREHSGRMRREVLWTLRLAGDEGMTDEQIQDALSMNPNTERPRRIELVTAGLVYDSGTLRKTRSGRLAAVWCAY